MTPTEKSFRLRGERSYSQARRAGDLLFISGTVSWDDEFHVVGEDDFRLQAATIYRDIGRTLAHFGLDFSCLIKETIYALDMDMLMSIGPVRAALFTNGAAPAATWIAVDRLVNPQFLLEIEAVAIMRSGDVAADTSAAPVIAQRRAFSRRKLEQRYGFSQAVRAGSLLFLSGTASWDKQAVPTNVGDFAAQLTNVYEELGETLAEHGAGFGDIVKETIFTCDMTSLVSAAPLRITYFGEHPPPASTWVQVKRLLDRDLLLQIEIIAELQ